MSVKAKKIQIKKDGVWQDIVAFKGQNYTFSNEDRVKIIDQAKGIIGRNADVLPYVHAATKYGMHTPDAYPPETQIVDPTKLNDEKRVGLLVMTDLHAHEDAFDRAIEYLGENDCLDAGICLGDVPQYFYNAESGWYINTILNNTSKPVYTAIGNHDMGYTMDTTQSTTQSGAYDKWIAPTVSKMGDSIISDSKKGYYAIDLSKISSRYKIILIFLNAYDMPNDIADNGKYKVSRDLNAYSQLQIDWFVDVLKNKVPEGYGVMVCQHQCPMRHKKTNCNWTNKNVSAENPLGIGNVAYKGGIIEDIINAWINRQAIFNAVYEPDDSLYEVKKNDEYQYFQPISGNELPKLTLNCNFLGVGENRIFICHLVGHAHNDMIGYSSKYPNQKIVAFTCTTAHRGVAVSKKNDLPRGLGTRTEDAITVMSIDIDERAIYLVRIGSNKTIDFTDRTYYRLSF